MGSPELPIPASAKSVTLRAVDGGTDFITIIEGLDVTIVADSGREAVLHPGESGWNQTLVDRVMATRGRVEIIPFVSSLDRQGRT